MAFRPYRAYEDYYSPHFPETPSVPAPQKPGAPTFTEGGTLRPSPPTRFVPPGGGRPEPPQTFVDKPPVRAGSLSPFGETFRGEMSLSDILSHPSIPAQRNLIFSNPGMFGLSGLFERSGMPGLNSFLLDASKSGTALEEGRMPNPDEIGIFLRKLLQDAERPGFRLKPSRLLGGRL